MHIKDVGFALALGVLFGGPSWGATLDAVKGDVLINQGQGFRAVAGTVEAKVGDTIMVKPGGSARVVYADGCPVPVTPGRVVTVAKESPCTALAADLPVYTKAPPPPEPVYDPFPLVGAAVVVGIGLCAAFCFQQSDPSSP